MDIESALELVGAWGKYQIRNYLLLGIATTVTSVHALINVFHAVVPEFICSEPGWNISSRDKCTQQVNGSENRCRSWNYSMEYGENMITEWNLVCQNNYLRATAQSIYMTGFLLGAFIFGQVSDKVGRKKGHLSATILLCISGTVAAFAPDYWTFSFARLVVGISTGGTLTIGYVWALEPIGKNYRMPTAMMFEFFFASSCALIAGLAFVVKNYWKLQLITSLAPLVFISYYFLLNESPRWLLGVNKVDELVKTFKDISSMNGKQYDDSVLEKLVEYQTLKNSEKDLDKDEKMAEQEVQNSKNGYERRHYDFRDLFKTPNMRKKTMNICFQWFTCSFTFYGLSLASSEMKVSPYVSVTLTGIMDMIGPALACLVLNRIGRRLSMSISLLFSSIMCFMAIILPSRYFIVIIVLAQLGTLGGSSGFAISYMYTAELMPTVVRNVGVGFGSVFARIGGLLAPFVAMFSARIALIVFGSCGLLAGSIVLLLPETLGTKLPETLEEGEEFGKEYISPCRFLRKRKQLQSV
ncbi:DgyrCDS3416 [Dimorphilus gyrociliatus]|uniref:DgyrCDS3416 n=1 Tax=Dimorphilus gyrociliatus TaxID=2664684 RepID=A0A7I8VDP8_9ANNE|nr:DgyrCDS3416 [Dimorphilus gyrociliatus]